MTTLDTITGHPIDWRDPRGYVRLRHPGHPLASVRGKVPRHRVILYEALGRPDLSPCHWCGYNLPWKSDLPRPDRHVVNVDHLNGIPGDDRPENLAPACSWCNGNRGWGLGLYPEHFNQLTRELADVPPWERPNAAAIVSEIVGQDVRDAWLRYLDSLTPATD